MTSKEIRQTFLNFFEKKGHLIVPSAPLVAKNDPTLMFNNSGMAQFKDFFLGNGTPPSKRIVDSQKCLRVSGKHNDLEEVGFDTYHHTMFEMLGNWSFGDYFKKEAIEWSYELLTEVYKLPKERLYVSVFEGDKSDGVPFDQESFDIWKNILGSDEKIIYGNKKDNFWEMGDIGPCGPCSEIHIDLRSQEEINKKPGKELVNADHPQVVEIWNNVFMEFERKADSSLLPLPNKHVDTGMGFERLCMAIQGKQSNYDTDLFQNTITVLEKLSNKKYGKNGTLGSTDFVDVSMRVIADHVRAVAFTIADGQLPSNAKAGYVIRRILRRAIRYGYTYLDFREPFICQLVPVLAEQFKGVFDELYQQKDFVTKVIEEEEKTFLRTLEQGLKRLDTLIEENKSSKEIKGTQVFELSDTFGFPVDLTALIAKEKGYSIDEKGFQTALLEQKTRSRKDATKEATDWIDINEQEQVEYLGYDTLKATAKFLKFRKVKTKSGSEFHLVLNQTPFYAEMGGQVGDTGTITYSLKGEEFKIYVVNTIKENDLFVHIVKKCNLESQDIKDLATIEVTAQVNEQRHAKIKQNHTATHLMLSAFRKVLGNHIVQRGSYQNEDITRFDFSHFSKVTDQELKEVELLVNEKIRENIPLIEQRNIPIDQAVAQGATATFGEKYGDFVRVITFDPNFSVELCGGSHVKNTGEIGLFKFISEGSVSAGVRRVEAKTGENAFNLFQEETEKITELKNILKGSNDVVKSVALLLDEKSALQKRIESLENDKLQDIKKDLLSKFTTKQDLSILAEKVNVPSADALKQLAYEIKTENNTGVIILGAVINNKPLLAVRLEEKAIDNKLHAGNIVKEAAKEMKGGGGGQPHFATAGGSNAQGLSNAINKAKELC